MFSEVVETLHRFFLRKYHRSGLVKIAFHGLASASRVKLWLELRLMTYWTFIENPWLLIAPRGALQQPPQAGDVERGASGGAAAGDASPGSGGDDFARLISGGSAAVPESGDRSDSATATPVPRPQGPAVGDLVEYSSRTAGRWVTTKVARVNNDGTYVLLCKPNTRIPGERIRWSQAPLAAPKTPPGPGPQSPQGKAVANEVRQAPADAAQPSPHEATYCSPRLATSRRSPRSPRLPEALKDPDHASFDNTTQEHIMQLEHLLAKLIPASDAQPVQTDGELCETERLESEQTVDWGGWLWPRAAA